MQQFIIELYAKTPQRIVEFSNVFESCVECSCILCKDMQIIQKLFSYTIFNYQKFAQTFAQYK